MVKILNILLNLIIPYKSFCWGLPDRMSVLQGTLYSEVFGFPFINLVFDFKANGAGWKPVPVKSIISHPMDSEAKLRHAEMGQGIKKAVNTLIEWNDNEWPRNPGSHCAKCIVDTCKEKKIINHV